MNSIAGWTSARQGLPSLSAPPAVPATLRQEASGQADSATHAFSLQAGTDATEPDTPAGSSDALRQAFDNFVGETFYGQLLGSLRKTTDKAAYFHGGRAEEVFQGQLDQLLAERMSEANAAELTGPMFELFMLGRP